MPYTKRQIETAQAIKHGMKATGSAKGFTRKFADQVIEESRNMATRRASQKSRNARAAFMMGKGAKAV